MSDFSEELKGLLNKHSMEGDSNTPDSILASFLTKCLNALSDAIFERERWYGRRTEDFKVAGHDEDHPKPT